MCWYTCIGLYLIPVFVNIKCSWILISFVLGLVSPTHVYGRRGGRRHLLSFFTNVPFVLGSPHPVYGWTGGRRLIFCWETTCPFNNKSSWVNAVTSCYYSTITCQYLVICVSIRVLYCLVIALKQIHWILLFPSMTGQGQSNHTDCLSSFVLPHRLFMSHRSNFWFGLK